ncbi:MAG: hypothetical protein WA393_01665 [Nitrososphaeraceae archaeon]
MQETVSSLVVNRLFLPGSIAVRTLAFRSLDEHLLNYNYAVCLEPFPLYRTYRDLESVCNYYRLTDDHKYKFPFVKVLSIAVN